MWNTGHGPSKINSGNLGVESSNAFIKQYVIIYISFMCHLYIIYTSFIHHLFFVFVMIVDVDFIYLFNH